MKVMSNLPVLMQLEKQTETERLPDWMEVRYDKGEGALYVNDNIVGMTYMPTYWKEYKGYAPGLMRRVELHDNTLRVTYYKRSADAYGHIYHIYEEELISEITLKLEVKA